MKGRFLIEEEWGNDITEEVGSVNYKLNQNNNMNQVNGTDVTFMSLALSDFAGVSGFLANHDYYVAGGLLVVGVVLVYLYHKYGSA